MYLSSATEPFSDAMLDDLLGIARTNNAEVGVTGLLLYLDGSFLQVLEGPAPAVAGIFAAIMRDPRHRSMLEVFNQDIAERSFPDWSMGFVRSDVTPADGNQAFLQLRQDVLGDAGYIKGPDILPRIISTFVHRLPAIPDR